MSPSNCISIYILGQWPGYYYTLIKKTVHWGVSIKQQAWQILTDTIGKDYIPTFPQSWWYVLYKILKRVGRKLVATLKISPPLSLFFQIVIPQNKY